VNKARRRLQKRRRSVLRRWGTPGASQAEMLSKGFALHSWSYNIFDPFPVRR